MILAVTGPRPDKLNGEYAYQGKFSAWVRNELAKKFNQYKPDTLLSGLAIGVDTIAALLAIEMGIPLFAILPFIGQEIKWTKEAQQLYHKILAHPKTMVKVVCEPGYAAWKFQRRNEWLSNECDTLVGVTDRREGGTKNCLDYAASIHKPIEIIDLKNIR